MGRRGVYVCAANGATAYRYAQLWTLTIFADGAFYLALDSPSLRPHSVPVTAVRFLDHDDSPQSACVPKIPDQPGIQEEKRFDFCI